ncbi:putative tricarboxylic transport membrane protein [Albimonas donghaensis]|uniref:Putative tricarboxylic transport membrane protein n=1 Tax=Albimonas donghaensis TaxID=356660 RepID=A0A1H3DS45_9RHOB|nr:tripartite tricarboxylate transporter permease [Albimonas donghaensis]SDX68479.1 putative tricarboxylic transport membrane protein [Albimonas donghaensis]
MIDATAFASALDLLTQSWQPWLVVPPGLLIGLIFGAVPGLSVPVAMAIFLPLTAYMDFLPAILFLTAIFTAGSFGGAIPAILVNVPGTAAAVATAFDGYPMAQAGRHSQALGLALAASTMGTAIGYVVLLLFVSPIAEAVLKLGPVEMFIIAIWGLTLIAALGGGRFSKGLLAGTLGVLLGLIGFSALGDMRGTMGQMALLDGVATTPALIGLFAASELFRLIRSNYIVEEEASRAISFRAILQGVALIVRHPFVWIRGGLLGVVIGAIPGVGSAVANLVSYSETKRRAKDSSRFGHGDPRGVTASESANSSSEGGSMATLLALGIPGGGATAVMLSAFAMHDVTGGPRFISENMNIIYGIILGNFAQVFLLMAVGLGFVFVASSVVRVPVRYLAPSVLALAVFGAYSLVGNISGPVTVMVFAVLGWFLRRHGYPVAAVVIGLLLGGMAEGELLRSYQISGGEVSYFLSRPVALVLATLLLASLLVPLVRKGRAARAAAASRAAP